MKNFYQIYKENIKNVSPVKELGGKNTLYITVDKKSMYKYQDYQMKMRGSNPSKEETVGLTTPKSGKGYKNFQEVYDDFESKITDHYKNTLKDPSKFYSEVYRYMAISILSAQLGLKISYQDKAKYKQFVDSFIEDHWINYKGSQSDSWTNIYPKSFSDPGRNVKSPGNKDMSVYIQIGDEDWEKIRISDHAIMSNKTATVMGIISKDTFEKLLFKSDGNILNFINEVKKEYNDFIEKGINDSNSIRKIIFVVSKYKTDMIKSISNDSFLSNKSTNDVIDILNKIDSAKGNEASVVNDLSEEEKRNLVAVINHLILTKKTKQYIGMNKISPNKQISVSIDDVNNKSKTKELFDIKKITDKYI